MMKNITTLKVKSREDALKYAYAFMRSKQVKMKECSFLNANPSKLDGIHLFPSDMYSAAYNEGKMPTWESFKANPVHISSPAFNCVGCVDEADKKRVILNSLENVVMFNCYGNYENEAKKAFEEITTIHASLK